MTGSRKDGATAPYVPVVANDVQDLIARLRAVQHGAYSAYAASVAHEAADTLAALSAQPAVAVPDGWKLVPTKMNAAMINAWSGGLTVSSDENAYRTSFQDAWQRVLAAAPQPAPSADLRDGNEGITRIAHQLPWAEKSVCLEEENERLRQRLNHYIKATTDKNSDLIAAEARLNALEADAGILLAKLDAFQEATGERLEAEDAAIVEAIRATLKGGE